MATIEERREVSNFDQISLEHTGELIIEQGDQESLVIEADEELLPKLKSDVRNGRLELGFRHWYDGLFQFGARNIRYRIGVRSLRGISISGAGKASSGSIQTDRMQLRVSGSGDFLLPSLHADSLDVSISGTAKARVSGAAPKVSIHVSGSGELDAVELASQSVTVRISGTGNVRVDAEESLDVRISGSGDVGYRGRPNLRQSISGVGNIHAL